MRVEGCKGSDLITLDSFGLVFCLLVKPDHSERSGSTYSLSNPRNTPQFGLSILLDPVQSPTKSIEEIGFENRGSKMTSYLANTYYEAQDIVLFMVCVRSYHFGLLSTSRHEATRVYESIRFKYN